MNKYSLLILAGTLLIVCQSCNVIRAFVRDGVDGPDNLSFTNGVCDTISNGSTSFRFAHNYEKGSFIDTLHFFKQYGTGFKSPATITQAIQYKTDNQGVIIIQNDTVLYEKFFGNFSAETNALIFSASKSITSLLCGIAVDEGYISNIDDPVIKYLPWLDKKDDRWKVLTVRHLLDMRAGFDASDSYSLGLKDFKKMKMMADLEYSHNMIRVIKRLNFKYNPGEVHEYNSITTAVLGLVIEAASGKSYSDYLSEKVWIPMGMEQNALVMMDSEKHHHAYSFGGIVTNMLDLAKIGRLYLNKGMWNGKRIVSKEWIDLSSDYTTENDGYSLCWYNISNVGYKDSKYPGFYALGIRGQVLYVNPYKKVIAVRMGRTDNTYAFIPLIFEELCNEYL